MTTTVYIELLATARTLDAKFAEQNGKETPQVFLKRLVKAIADVPEPAYDAMSEGARAWYDAAVDQSNAKSDITAPEGMGGAAPAKAGGRKKPAAEAAPAAAAAPAATAATMPEFTDAAGKPLAGLALVNAKRKWAKENGGAAPAAAAKPATAPKAPKAAKVKTDRGPTAGEIIRGAVLQNLKEDVAGICAILKKQGHSIPDVTVRTYHTDAHHVVRIAKAMGLWK